MANPVVFKFGLRAQYDALQAKDPNALYFLTDSHELYKGTDAIATNSGLYSDIKTVENSDVEVINNYYTNNSKVPFVGDVFIVRTHIVDEDYAQSVYMYDGQKWESISSTIMIEGDNKSIEVDEHNVIALKDYGKRFYKFIEETGSKEDGTFVAAHYELVEVDGDNPWIAGLEPKVVLEDGEYIIGWYQPNLVTAAGVQNQVVAIQKTVLEVQEDVANIEQELANNYYTKTDIETNYYTKTDVDGKVSGVFHFKGTADNKEDLPADGNTTGDVYQVGDREYAWNDTEWVELGFVVDLSGHATKDELKQVADDLDLAEIEISKHADRIGNLEAVGAEKNVLVGVSLNNTAFVPNEERIVDIIIPNFNGTVAGLVPVAANGLTNKAQHFLNAEGNWASINIGNLGAHTSITDYIDAKIVETTPIWSEM